MRRLPQNISMLAVSIFTVSAVAIAPVYAREGSSGSGDSSNTTTTASNSTSVDSGTATGGGRGPGGISVKTADSTENENETETHTMSVAEKQSLESQSQKLLETKRQDGKTKSVADRQKACDAHKSELTTRSQNYARNAQKHLDTFNSIYTKVLAFQTAKNLNAVNFDTLKSAADAKQAAAESAVNALSDPSLATIDCTAQDPAQNVAALKTAVANARTALQEYRTAVKNVIVALQTAKTDSSTSTNATTEAN